MGKSSQPGMIGGLTGRPLSNSTGPGTPTPIPRTSLPDRPTSSSSSVKRSATQARARLRPEGDVQVGCALGQRRADEIAHRYPRMRGAEVGDEDDAGFAVEREHGCGTTAGGGAASGFIDEALREQRVDPLGDSRAGKPGLSGQVRPCDCDLLADQAQECARTGRGGLGRQRVRHVVREK